MLKTVSPRFTITKRDEDALWRRLDRLARSLEREIAEAFFSALEALQARFPLEAIVEALESGDIEALIAFIEPDAPIFDTPRQALRSSLIQAAQAEAQGIPVTAGLTLAALTPVGAAALSHALQETRDRQRAALSTRGASSALPPPVGRLEGPVGRPDDHTRMVVRFNVLHPRLIDYLDRYELDLIREITDSIKEGIRAALVQGMRSGKNPRDTARQVRQVIGLTERQAAAVGAFRKELESFHERSSASGYNLGGKISRAPGGAQTFAVDDRGKPKDKIRERRLRDFRYDKTLARAMNEDKPLTSAQVDKMTAAYARKYLRYRSEMIARTESLRTVNQGIIEAWRQAAEQGLVKGELRKKWITALGSDRTCLICRPMPKLNAGVEGQGIPLEARFQTGKGGFVTAPPVHPACRCIISIKPI